MDKVKIWQNTKKGIYATVNKLKSKSQNSKTGDMAGLYVLPLDEKPTDSIKNKRDDKQCGTCPLRGSVCYVNPISTNGVWSSSVDLPAAMPPKTDKPIRLGVYGDSGLLPVSKIASVVRRFSAYTGYTHQWRHIPTDHAKYHMASVDNISAAAAGMNSVQLKEYAHDLGYRTYRIINDTSELQQDEIMCPHYTHGVQCSTCLLCDGANNKKNIAAMVHGAPNKIKTYMKG